MKSYLRISHLVIFAATLLHAADSGIVPQGGLTVHEWGTFTSVAGENGSAVTWTALGGKDDLPSFVNHGGCFSVKSGLSGTVRMETPVLYFYSAHALEAHVKVAFPKGLITEWYPQARAVSGAGPRNGGIEWESVKVEPDTTPALPVEISPSRYYAARTVDAAPLAVGQQHEKFLFYRGVGNNAVPLSARVSDDGGAFVTNLTPDPLPLMMLFENRGGRLGYRTAGADSVSVTLDPPVLDGNFSQLRDELENALVAQGLFRKEAQAMLETWRDSWFEEGSRVIYIVPSRAVDAMLPLQIDPVPSETKRVFVGRIELIAPATKRAVADAVAAGDRMAASRYGRFLDPILRSVAADSPAIASQVERFRAGVQEFFLPAACR